MIVAVYARKSTDDSDRNAEARSTARQIDHATAYARAKGWTVDPRYVFVDEAASGAEWKHRPGFNALLAALEPRPPFGVVIVSELSRIGRDAVRTPAAIAQIEDAGVTIHAYLTGAVISLADESSEVHTIFDSLAASFERRRGRQRSTDASRRRAEAGAVTGGRCYGYQNVRRPGGFVYRVIDDPEAAIIRRIFTLYAEGDGIIRIAKGLNGDQIPSPRGGTGSWSPCTVREILRRDLYRGRQVWGRTQKITRRGTKAQRLRPVGEWLQREVPGLRIVSEALWATVEARRHRIAVAHEGHRRGRPAGAGRAQALLSGLARCARCGGSLVALTRRHGTGAHRHRADLYGCAYHQKRGPAVCTNDVVIRQDRLEAAFLDALAEVLDEQIIARAVTRAVERVQRRSVEAPDQRAGLERERTAITTAIRHLLENTQHGSSSNPSSVHANWASM